MANLNTLRDKLEQAAHEYLLAKAADKTTFPKGYGKINVHFRISCEGKKPVIFHDYESIEKTVKP
jgi:hypothetical protein